MNIQSLLVLTAFTFISLITVSFGQAPNLGTAASFVLFSTAGAVGNTGISQVTGNVGTQVGAITNFGNVNGVMHNVDAATAQAAIDLQAAWYHLNTTTPTLTIGPVLGGGDTLFAGVDTVVGAGSLAGILYLDAQGDSTAIFIIKIGAAFSTSASAQVNLINGALACNVFWVAEGAISMATLTIMRGNLIAHNGAISMGDGCILEGRALSTTGAVTIYGTHAYIPPNCGGPSLSGPLTPAPPLRSIECYALFSNNGAVSNSGITNVIGDVGTNTGATTGYNASLVTGTIHPIPDTSTAQGAIDLLKLYAYLDSLPYQIELLYPAQFGNKLVLTGNTYRMNAATSFTDTLFLNAEGNADAVFVIQIVGALVTSTYSTVRLINGAQAKNVYWKVEGAVTINDNSIFCGTIVSNNGAIVLNTAVTLEGRALTTTGAVTTTAMTVNKPSGCSFLILPLGLVSFTGICDDGNVVLKWSTDSEVNKGYYCIERSSDAINWEIAGTVRETGHSSARGNYMFTVTDPSDISYFRIKQTSPNGNFVYFKSIVVNKCPEDFTGLDIFPNPSNGTLNLSLKGNQQQAYSLSIYNVSGDKIYTSEKYQPVLDLTGKPGGVYILRFILNSKIIIKKLVINQ